MPLDEQSIHSEYPSSQPFSSLFNTIVSEYKGWRYLAHSRALQRIEDELERLFPADIYYPLIDPAHDWED